MAFHAERPRGVSETSLTIEMTSEFSPGLPNAGPMLSEEDTYFSIERMDALGSSSLLGVAAIGVLAIPEIGVVLALTAGMALASSVASTIVNLAGSDDQRRQLEQVKALFSGPSGLTGGVIGQALNGDTGMMTGALIGGLGDFWNTFNVSEDTWLLYRLAEARGVFDAASDVRKLVERYRFTHESPDSDFERNVPTGKSVIFDTPPNSRSNYDTDHDTIPYEDLPEHYIA
ncbi:MULTISPECIES: hypothetical protein [unclassified Mesorhizobium]|uniref:hypothetical protein n=1 Tax=unclassified Mesorhizobium TaxID=325217 RepID=UPI001129330B|nr:MULTISPECIES: hypothetical protein [unclassified Mesorhizobium]TPK53795.1 hypothetical protein FJ550_09325 [Mesorhizobium sp. B2-5-2]TPL17196.1 hypothetical protein FJ946_28955 [Mesorhizobium sp. B2-4-7]TPL33393.1 hypothetical protein FJ961_28725 [Mesorhizobium sp. B2-4-5]TPM68071.1 hypothetical protein FJ968_30070 [Mesorhizobium sp. B2-1-6]TPN73653.1 hypothetical protein FJ985_25900 [Mesorhizobium sp. B1-1-2]